MTTEELLEKYKNGERDFRDSDLADANLSGASLSGANLSGANLSGADHIEAHPELHEQSEWGDGEADPTCGTPCCVAGWACHLGGGRREDSVATAAMKLLWVDGLPMPSFSGVADKEGILAALRANHE